MAMLLLPAPNFQSWFKSAFILPVDNTAVQFIRIVIVGFLCSAVDLVIRHITHKIMSFDYQIAVIAGYAIGTIINYLLGAFWVFQKNHRVSLFAGFLIFIVISGIALLINLIIVKVFYQDLKLLRFVYANILALMISFVWSFSARKWGLYRVKK